MAKQTARTELDAAAERLVGELRKLSESESRERSVSEGNLPELRGQSLFVAKQRIEERLMLVEILQMKLRLPEAVQRESGWLLGLLRSRQFEHGQTSPIVEAHAMLKTLGAIFGEQHG